MSEGSPTPDLAEVVTGLFEAADREDWEAVISAYAPDAVWETEDGILDVAGASGVRGLLEDWAGAFEDWTIKVETVVDLGNGIVYSVYHQEGRPPGRTPVVGRLFGRQDIDEARVLAERLAERRPRRSMR